MSNKIELVKGVKLVFINEPGTVTFVKHLPNGKMLVEDEFGFEVEVLAKELMTQQGQLLHLDIPLPENESSNQTKEWPAGVTILAGGKVAVDLHMENLCTSEENKRILHPLKFQLNVLKRTLQCARIHKKKYICAIHGKGKGTLRSEVVHLLTQEKDVKFWDASFDQYGGGAIEIELFGLTR